MITPLRDRVLIGKDQTTDQTESGIVLVQPAKTATNTTTATGTIQATGPLSELVAGNRVIFDEGWGNEVEPGLFLISESDVKAYLS